jgi:death-on-curing protein
VWRPDLEDYLATARVVLELPYEQLRRLPGLPLAESALAAPFAGFGGEEVYPAREQKAAVLLERLVRNHPLPDGNKRTAFLVMLQFLERNGRRWEEPDVSEDGETVRRLAAREISADDAEDWIRRRIARA